MAEGNRSPRRLVRRLGRLVLIGLPALLGLVLIGIALAVSGKIGSIALPQELGTLQSEATALLSTVEGASRLRISEEELSRLGAAALLEGATNSGGSLTVLGFEAIAESGRLKGNFAFRALLPGGLPVGRVQTTASIGFDVASSEEALLLTPNRLRLGRLPLPPSFLVAAYGRAASRGLLRDSPVQLADNSFAIPLDLLNKSLPPVARVSGVAVVPGGLDLFVHVDSATAMTFLSNSAPLLNHVLPGLGDALSEEGLTADFERLLEAVTTPEDSSETPEPAAVVSYLENEVQVLFEAESFVPELGEDLYARSSVRTGRSSATELLLRDRSVVRVSEETQFELRSLPGGTGEGTELQLTAGSLRAKVNKVIEGDARFTLRTNSAVLGVRGTDLFVQLEPEGDLTLAVLEGSVGITPEGGEETVVEAGRELSVGVDELAESPQRPLETRGMEPRRREEIEQTLSMTASPDDQNQLREQYRLASIIEELRRVGATVMTMTPEAQERLARSLQQRIDMEWARQEFDRLMGDSQFAELMDAFGIDELLLTE